MADFRRWFGDIIIPWLSTSMVTVHVFFQTGNNIILSRQIESDHQKVTNRSCSVHTECIDDLPIGHCPSIRSDMVPSFIRTWSLFPIGPGPSIRSDMVPRSDPIGHAPSDRTWSLHLFGHGPSF